ncbi:hypothetical protein VO57_008935 [Citromicrobium bathyomarinum]|nr:hypothetical protein [Citromicrobium sp. JL2201]KPM22246.1 hypothetical protein VO57_12400 [Citromicrobium sp. JL2201]
MTTKDRSKTAPRNRAKKDKTLRVDFIRGLRGLDDQPLERQVGVALGEDGKPLPPEKQKKVPLTLRYLVAYALDKSADSKGASLRRGELYASLGGTDPVDLDKEDVALIEKTVYLALSPIAIRAILKELDLVSDTPKPASGAKPYDLDRPVLDIDGEPKLREGPDGLVELDIRFAVREALNDVTRGAHTTVTDGAGRPRASTDRKELERRGELLDLIGLDGLAHLDNDDIVLIENRVHDRWEPSVLYAVRQALSEPVKEEADAK